MQLAHLFLGSNYLESSRAFTCLPKKQDSEKILEYCFAGLLRRHPIPGPATAQRHTRFGDKNPSAGGFGEGVIELWQLSFFAELNFTSYQS